MTNLLSRLKLLCRMDNDNLNLQFTGTFSESQLNQACERIETHGLKEELVGDRFLQTQQELIENAAFAALYQKLCAEEVAPAYIDQMIKAAWKTQEHLTDYPQEDVLEAIKENIGVPLRFLYLKYFLPAAAFEEDKEAWVRNLCYLPAELQNLAELTESQFAMLRLPFVGEYLFKWHDHERKSLDQLAANEPLQEILGLLYEGHAEVDLRADQLQRMHWLRRKDVEKFRRLLYILEYDSEDIGSFMGYWLENNAAPYDLDWFAAQPERIRKERREKILGGRVSYLNALYGGKLQFDFENSALTSCHTDVLVYAYQNHKRHFLDLVNQNHELFSSLGRHALLFVEGFREHCNLNSLTSQDLENCRAIFQTSTHFDLLEEGQQYTFAEMLQLWHAPQQYVQLYVKLTPLAVDQRLLTIRQLLKHALLDTALSENEERMEQLIRCLLQETFDRWYRDEFAHIRGLKRRTAVQLLEHYDEVQRFVPDFQTESDAVFAVHNAGRLAEYSNWPQLRSEILTADQDWLYLKDQMNYSDGFVTENQEHIVDFLLRGGSAMVRPLYDYFTAGKDREALRRIVQAELVGQFYTLKYFKEDLQHELQYPIGKGQEELWKQNLSMERNGRSIEEVDDFYNTLQIGELPYSTCISYLHGSYRECVLAGFDSNKKMILGYQDGAVVARACIRLTKGSFHDPQYSNFSFVDLAHENEQESKQADQECLVLFLENAYISGVNQEEAQAFRKLMVKLVRKKATDMGVLPVLAQSYVDTCTDKEYVTAALYMYISKSKSGKQYLDSLGGAAVTSDEDTYERRTFGIRKRDLDPAAATT